MVSDLKFIIFWWLIIFLLGTISLPLIFALFKKFWDKGYIFSKIISISLLTYLIFIFGVFRILPFTNLSLFLIILLFLGIDAFYLIRLKKLSEFLEIIKSKYKIFLFEEILFLIILISWSFIRSFNSDIEGLEKFMDWGFINSALRSTYMPPVDMWFSGSPINYYYFGHLIFAVLTKLSSISSAITYNLAIATVCALTFVSAFSISSNLVFIFLKKNSKLKLIIFSGLVSALLLTFGGNLHPVYKVITTGVQKTISSYWYPDATRFIGFDPDTKDKTIHEFPSYSFVVADLHGHMNDIPIVLFFCAMIFSLTLSSSSIFLNWKLIIGSGLVLSIAYMTNAWDFAIYGILFAIFIFSTNLKNTNFLKAFNKTIFTGLLTIIFWYLFSLPFSLNFIPMTEGLRLSDSHTPFYQLFILYGGFWLICLPFVFYLIYLFIIKKNKKIKISDYFVFSLIITATILVIIPEIGYIKDIYIYEYRRANTMFKLVYEAFIMYSLTSGYILIRLTRSKNLVFKNIYKLLFFIIFLIHMIYPYFSIKSFYDFKSYKGLWGLNYLKNSYPDNFNATNWINQNIKGQPVIVEATGDSYTTFNQVSVVTGLPTIEGWLVHEWLWRGGYDKPGARQEEVRKVYESENLNEVKIILQKYKVEYIFVGTKEYEKYPKLDDKRFEKIGGKIIFQSGNTKIYKI